MEKCKNLAGRLLSSLGKTKTEIRLLITAFILTLAAFPPNVYGSDEVLGAKAIGMAGSFRATADDNSAIFLNPAGITQKRRYTITVGYGYLSPSSADLFSGSIVDSKTSPIGAGIAYVYRGANQQRGEEQEVVIAVAQEYIKSLHIGLATRHLWREAREDGWKLDASILFNPLPFLIIGIVSKNLIRIEGDQREMDFAFASRLGKVLNIDFDLVWLPALEESNWGYHLGGEILIRNQIGLRGGYAFDREGRDWYGLGLGWYIPRGLIGYAFRREVGGGDEIGHWIEIEISI